MNHAMRLGGVGSDPMAEGLGRREDLVTLGLWMFLATVTMLFAAFTSAYIVRRSGADWRSVPLPSILWINTLALAGSSLAVEAGRSAGRRGRWRGAGAAMALSIALGAGFLFGQVQACRQLVAAGFYASASPYGSFVYMLTAVHGLHVAAALLVLVWGAAKTWTGTGQRDMRRWRGIIGVCRTFWHFLGAVWVYLFVLLSRY